MAGHHDDAPGRRPEPSRAGPLEVDPRECERHDPTTKGPFWLLVRRVVGVALILLGIIGLFLPILQGVLFITLGLILLVGKAKARILLSAARARLSRFWKGCLRLVRGSDNSGK